MASTRTIESETHNDSAPEGEIPEYLEVADIVRVSTLTENTVREHLKRLELTEKIGNKLYVPRLSLREKWPSLYRVLMTKAAEGKALRPPRPSPPRRKGKATEGEARPSPAHAA